MDVFVIGRFPPPLDGQTLATQRVADLLTTHHTVHCVNTEPPPGDYVAAEVRFRPDRVWHYLGLRKPIREALRAFPYAPVLWTSASPVPLGHWRDMLTVLPAFHPQQPVYAVLHRATLDEAFRSPLTALTARRMAQRLSGFVFLSASISERCAPWISAKKRFVISNTIDETVLCTDAEVTARQKRNPDRPLDLLFLSHMMPEKGYLDVLDAVVLLRERGLSIHMHFVGGWVKDVDRMDFEQRLTAGNLHDVVTHHGSISDRTRIKEMYLDADVFLLPSYHPTEAQPIVLLEAMNAGLPVITTRHGSLPDLIGEDEAGRVVPTRNPTAIANAVDDLAGEATWQKISQQARARFLRHYSPDAVREQWEALIHQA